jgi:DNA-directed RNA polymerase subunit beta'
MKAKKIEPNAMVSVAGVGATTPGRCLINSVLPTQVRDYGLIWTAKAAEQKLVDVDKKLGREAFKKALTALSDIGRQWAYLTGASFLLSDLQVMTKERNDAYRVADKQADLVRRSGASDAEKKRKLVEIYQGVSTKLTDNMSLKANASGGENNITQMLVSGARGSRDQVRQLVANVGVMLDHENRPMALPVRGTYTEGLDTAEYFQHMFGARKGMIDKSQAVKDPGALTKQMVVSATGYRVASTDCGTQQGLMMSTTGDDAMDRYLAENITGVAKRNDLVTSTVLAAARRQHIVQIKVRSPITCQVPQGVCVKCYGLTEEGTAAQLGDHVGIRDVQAITEPSTQLALKQFHLGGVATAGKASLTSGFDRAAQLFEMPDSLRGSAVVAEINGRVEKIETSPFGGHLVTVGAKKHRIPRDRVLKVKVGDMVQAGTALTDGPVKPQDTLRLLGLRALQVGLRDDIQRTFADGGVRIKAKAIEPAVKMLTDTVRVTDAGTHPHLVTGDYGSLSQVEAWNRSNPTADPVKFVHELPGSEFLPHRQDDWAHRMAHNRLRQGLQEAATQAGTAGGGTSPFASIFFGRQVAPVTR